MLINTRAIVIKTTKYGDTSIISHLLTEARGLKSFIVNGVRTKRASMPMILFQPGSVLDIQMYSNEQKKLLRIKEAKSHFVWTKVPFDIRRSSLTLFIAEVVQKTIHESEENHDLFNDILTYLHFIDTSNELTGNIPLHFLIKLSGHLGFHPQGQYSEATPLFDLLEGSFCTLSNTTQYLPIELSEILSKLIYVPIEEVHAVVISKQNRRNLLEQLLHYYKLHIENFPLIKSHEVFHSIMEI